jgi:hypothetical protein
LLGEAGGAGGNWGKLSCYHVLLMRLIGVLDD